MSEAECSRPRLQQCRRQECWWIIRRTQGCGYCCARDGRTPTNSLRLGFFALRNLKADTQGVAPSLAKQRSLRPPFQKCRCHLILQ
jgi:hypothetical protein